MDTADNDHAKGETLGHASAANSALYKRFARAVFVVVLYKSGTTVGGGLAGQRFPYWMGSAS